MTTTVTAEDNAPKVLISQAGRKGDPGTNGTNGDGFNQVRKSLLDNPLCHLFKTNKLVETSAPTSTDTDVTWNRSTSATYLDRYGVVKTASINTPREEKEGFLIEGASTNLARYSEQFDNAVWIKTGATVITNNRTAPDGTITGERITADGTTAIHGMYQTHTVSPSTTYNYSVFVEAGTEVEFFIYEGALTGARGTFNLTLKTATTTQTGVTATIAELDSGWFRCTMTYTTGAAQASARFYNILGSTLGGVASNKFMWFWGAQAEQLSFASSYIPTVGNAVTRTADLVNVSSTNNISLLNLDNTISFTCDTIGNNAPFNQAIITSVATNTFSRTLMFWSGSDVVVLDYLSGFPYSYFATQEDTNNIVSSYNAGSLISYVNGAQVFNSAAPYTDLAISSSLIIGSSGSSEFLFGHIKDLKIYDFALNANEAEYLSA